MISLQEPGTGLPSGWHLVKVSDLLTEEQMKSVSEIFTRAKVEKRTEQWLVAQLKEYLNQHQEQLEAKGVLPDYLACMLLLAVAK